MWGCVLEWVWAWLGDTDNWCVHKIMTYICLHKHLPHTQNPLSYAFTPSSHIYTPLSHTYTLLTHTNTPFSPTPTPYLEYTCYCMCSLRPQLDATETHDTHTAVRLHQLLQLGIH